MQLERLVRRQLLPNANLGGPQNASRASGVADENESQITLPHSQTALTENVKQRPAVDSSSLSACQSANQPRHHSMNDACGAAA
jgi:hypothetical protein